MPKVSWTFNCRILRVVDGDTVRVLTDLGFRAYQEMSIRLAGVDTPEIFRGDEEERAAGMVAKQLVEDWFKQHGEHYVMTTDKDRSSFNRYIALSFLHEETGDDLIQMLIDQGYGVKE